MRRILRERPENRARLRQLEEHVAGQERAKERQSSRVRTRTEYGRVGAGWRRRQVEVNNSSRVGRNQGRLEKEGKKYTTIGKSGRTAAKSEWHSTG